MSGFRLFRSGAGAPGEEGCPERRGGNPLGELLTEMDGFSTLENVGIVATTNPSKEKTWTRHHPDRPSPSPLRPTAI